MSLPPKLLGSAGIAARELRRALIVACARVSILPVFAASVAGQVHEFPIEPAAPGDVRREVHVLEHVAEASGWIHVFATSADADLALRVTSPDDAALAVDDDDGGGATTPCVRVASKPGLRLRVAVLAVGERAGSGSLHLREAPETAVTYEAATSARGKLEELRGLRQLERRDEARAVLATLIDGLQTVAGRSDSQAVTDALAEAAIESYWLVDHAQGARAWRAVLDFHVARLPDTHPKLAQLRGNLANALRDAGRLDEALEVGDSMLAALAAWPGAPAALVEDALLCHGGTLAMLGRSREAVGLLERGLDVAHARGAPDGDLLPLENNLAAALLQLGQVERARVVLEDLHLRCGRNLPAEHPFRLAALRNLAWARQTLGDFGAARDLQQEVVDIVSRTAPAGDPERGAAQLSLGATLAMLGQHAEAVEVLRAALSELPTELEPHDPRRVLGQTNLAMSRAALGESAEALEELQALVDGLAASAEPHHPLAQAALTDLAVLHRMRGDHASAAGLFERIVEANARALPVEHPQALRARTDLALCRAALGRLAVDEVRALMRDTRASLEHLGEALAPREIQALAIDRSEQVDVLLSLADALPGAGLDEDLFALVESARAVAETRLALEQAATALADDDEAAALRGAVAAARARVGELAQGGVDATEWVHAVQDQERAQRALRSHLLADERYRARVPSPQAADIVAGLRADEAAVGFWRRSAIAWEAGVPTALPREDRYTAFVLRPDRPVARIELGPAAAIDRSVEAWRAGLAVGVPRGGLVGNAPQGGAPAQRAAGEDLRRRVLDPLEPTLGDARRIVVAPDDALHLVPLDALPDGDGLVGDRRPIVLRSALKELTVRGPAPGGPPSLLALGGVDFGVPADAGPAPAEHAGRSSLPPLPATRDEVADVARVFREAFPSVPPEACRVLAQGEATVDALRFAAPGVRYLHLATHAWFAPPGMTVMGERGSRSPVEHRPAMAQADLAERVVGHAPLLLCGIALAGASAAGPAAFGGDGILTGEDLLALDLSGCSLAVLSACETGLGVGRSGQGLASLQRALRAAGARTVVTSLWKVPDAPTRLLMAGFYRRLLLDGQGPAEALWAAKREMREASAAGGAPLHSPADWAAWVLCGEPD